MLGILLLILAICLIAFLIPDVPKVLENAVVVIFLLAIIALIGYIIGFMFVVFGFLFSIIMLLL